MLVMRTDAWHERAVHQLLAERDDAQSTPLRELHVPGLLGSRLLFKDESAHPTGSLKHRLARSLLLQGIASRRIGPTTPLFDASSGNTAVSEAYFAHLLGLKYFAVMPSTTSPGKLALVRRYGGACVFVAPGRCCKAEAARLAAEQDGYFLDQFSNAATATDWRDHNVITEMLSQFEMLGMAAPDWFVMGAGTGGTSTCAGRCFRHRKLQTRTLVVDPEDSAFFGHYACDDRAGCLCASRVEGIGRPTVEASFHAELVDCMQVVPDAASFAGARWLSQRLGQPVGISSGTHLVGAISLLDTAQAITVATLICDHGSRYSGRLDNDDWLRAQQLDLAPWLSAFDGWAASGHWNPPVQSLATWSRTSA